LAVGSQILRNRGFFLLLVVWKPGFTTTAASSDTRVYVFKDKPSLVSDEPTTL